MLASDLEHHFVRAHAGPLAELDRDAATASLGAMAREARATLAAEGYTGGDARLAFAADLRYEGQGSELTVPLTSDVLDNAALSSRRAGLCRDYTAMYSYASEE